MSNNKNTEKMSVTDDHDGKPSTGRWGFWIGFLVIIIPWLIMVGRIAKIHWGDLSWDDHLEGAFMFGRDVVFALVFGYIGGKVVRRASV